jgi:hypothetical protein
MKPWLRRLALAALGIAALLYPAYLVAGNYLLRGGWLERKINGRPDRLVMHWSSAWTPWPGVVHVRGFSMRSQSSVFQWALAVDQATCEIDLLALRRRELRIGPLHGSGVVFRLHRRLDAPPRSVPARPELYPPIAGFAAPNPTQAQAQKNRPQGPPRSTWYMRFTGVDLDDVRELWVEEYRFAGRARVAGGFETRVLKSLRVMPARVEFLSGAFTMGAGPKASPILADAKGRVDGRIDPYPPMQFKGWKVFQFVTGRAQLGGRVASLSFLEMFFRQMHWVDLSVGPGPITADVRLRRGEILAGSRLDAHPDGITMGFLDYTAAGFGGVLWSVAPLAGGDREGRLALVFDTFRLQRRGYAQAHVQGRGLRVDARSTAPRFGGLFTPKHLAIDLPRAEVPDLTFYNAYLPRQSAVALTGGSGRISGRFEAAAPDWKGSGEMKLTAPGVGLRFERKRLRGNVKVHTRLRSVDLDDHRFDISGSDFELTDAVVLGAPGTPAAPGTGASWWARGHLDRALLVPGAPIYLRASVESTLSDPRPLFALFAPVERSRMLRWVDRLLKIQGVGATADLTVGQDFFDVSHLAIAGGKAEILGRLRVVDSHRRGVLYASYGAFNVGLELKGEKRDWKILHPRQWYENYPPF